MASNSPLQEGNIKLKLQVSMTKIFNCSVEESLKCPKFTVRPWYQGVKSKTCIPRTKISKLFTNKGVCLSCLRLLIKLWSGLAEDSEAVDLSESTCK